MLKSIKLIIKLIMMVAMAAFVWVGLCAWADTKAWPLAAYCWVGFCASGFCAFHIFRSDGLISAITD